MNTPHLLTSRSGPMLLHPRYIMRVAGESVLALQDIDTGATAGLLAEGERQKAALREQSAALCTALERAIHACTDRDLGRMALNVKRAIFNLRASKAEHVQALAGLVDETTLEHMLQFNAAARELATLDQRVLQAYEAEIDDTSARFASLWQLPRLRDAISYTNPGLFREFEEFARPGGKPLARKAARKLQNAFAQYLARCSTKTSPLSTFTVMHVGRWNDSLVGDWSLDYAPELDRRIALKGALMRQILAPLLADYDSASQLFALVLNPSLVLEDGRARFRTVNEGNTKSGRSYGTGEATAEIHSNAAIACLHHVFAQRHFEAIHERDLITAMCTLAPKLQPATVRELLRKLYDLRLLLPDAQAFEQADPLEWTCGLLKDLPDERGRVARAHLVRVREALEEFKSAEPQRRAALVGAVEAEIGALCEALGAPREAAANGAAFFENCYLPQVRGGLGPRALEPFADDLHLLLLLAPVLGFTQQARCDMADFFLAEFGADGVCDAPLEFIRRFDEAYALGSLTHAPDPQRRAAPTAVSEGFARARKKFNDLIKPLLREQGDVQLDRDALHDIVQQLPESVRMRGSSQSYLGQIAQRDGRPMLVVNQVFGGRSSLMSRFLEVLSPDEVREVHDYLASTSEAGVFAELPGVFGFNANQHPRMADSEVVVPPFAPNWEETRKLEIGKLRMVYDAREHMVRFRTQDGQDIDVWYQGFLMPMLLPRVQRVLAIAYTEGLNSFAMFPMMELGLMDGEDIARVPRISLGDVVLARRTWVIPAARQPDADLDDADFFVAVQGWRKAAGLPNEVFLRGLPAVAPQAKVGTGLNFNWDAVDFKDLKPFHVRFDSPQLVRLMRRTLKRNSFTIIASEVLPALDDQHVKVQGQPHVSELQFELSTLPQRLQAIASDASWHALRIAYFDDDRRALLLGPVSDLIDGLRRDHGIDRVMLSPHWRHGPHVDLVVHCSQAALDQHVWPAVRATLLPWLQAHPSRRVIEPAAYESLAARLALFELDPEPALPLLENNTVTSVPYRQPKALKLEAFARAREEFHVGALPLALDLLRLKGVPGDDFFLALAAMLAMAGRTYEIGGLSRGYVSLRSHADYFFAAHDEGGVLKARFDALDARLAARVDATVRAVLADRLADAPLAPAARALLDDWQRVLAPMAAENRRIVARNFDVLLADETFERLQGSVTRLGADDFQARMRSREHSEIGRALGKASGRSAMSTPEIMAYRTTLNFFYTLLPLLGTSPMQKFCLCHLVALSVERVLGVSWRDITGIHAASNDKEVQA